MGFTYDLLHYIKITIKFVSVRGDFHAAFSMLAFQQFFTKTVLRE